MQVAVISLESNVYVQLQMKFERDISVKIKGHALSCNIARLVQPRLALPQPELFDVVSDLGQGDRDRLTLSVVGGRWTGGTVNCVMRQFRSTEDGTFSIVAV